MAPTFTGPCVAVIFTSKLREGEELRKRYGVMAKRMSELATQQPGYILEESTRQEDGFGISVSYWKDEESARAWKENKAHAAAQKMGKEQFYEWFSVRVAQVGREYGGQTP